MPRAFALAVLLAAASAGSSALEGGRAAWTEVPWPFPRDAWPAGRAFRCDPAACGGAVALYVRAKRGLCANCDAGVTADWEVDAAGDLDTMSSDFAASAPGAPIALAGLRGRWRPYRLQPGGEPAAAAVVSRAGQCDLLVVAMEGAAADPPAVFEAVATLLGPAAVEAALEGR